MIDSCHFEFGTSQVVANVVIYNTVAWINSSLFLPSTIESKVLKAASDGSWQYALLLFNSMPQEHGTVESTIPKAEQWAPQLERS